MFSDTRTNILAFPIVKLLSWLKISENNQQIVATILELTCRIVRQTFYFVLFNKAPVSLRRPLSPASVVLRVSGCPNETKVHCY